MEPEPLTVKAGGLGFTAFSGEATGERSIRNVVVTPARGNSLRLESDMVRLWSSTKPDTSYPKRQDNMILLSKPGFSLGANAYLLNGDMVKEDFGVEFEYSAGESGPGNGFSFLFAADRGEFEKSARLSGGMLPNSGYRVQFGARGIGLADGSGSIIRNTKIGRAHV